MFGSSRVLLLFISLVTVTIIPHVDAFVSRSIRIGRNEGSFVAPQSSKKQTTPTIASHRITRPSAPKIWSRLSLSFWKRVIRKRDTRFLLIFQLVLGLWRTPPIARASDELTSTTMETIGMDKSVADQVLIQPVEKAA